MMDAIDQQIAEILQTNGRVSSAEVAQAVGVSVSTANDRIRRLHTVGIVTEWRGVLDPARVGAGVCIFVLIDMKYEGEEQACAALRSCPEVQELHHISGPHSYLMKLRVRDMPAFQAFLKNTVKPLPAVIGTETLISLDTLKETSAVLISV